MSDWHLKNRDRVLFYKKAMYWYKKYGYRDLLNQYREIYCQPKPKADKSNYKKFDPIRQKEYKKAYYHLTKHNNSSLMNEYKLKWAN